MPSPWTTRAPAEGRAYMIMLRPLVHGSIWWGYVYRPDHWPALVASGWLRARLAVQDDPGAGRAAPLGRVPEHLKN